MGFKVTILNVDSTLFAVFQKLFSTFAKCPEHHYNDKFVAFLDGNAQPLLLEMVFRNRVRTSLNVDEKRILLAYLQSSTKGAVLEESNDGENRVTRWSHLLDHMLISLRNEFSFEKFKDLWDSRRADALEYMTGMPHEPIQDADTVKIMRLLSKEGGANTLPVLRSVLERYRGDNVLEPIRKAFFLEAADNCGLVSE
jgi:hypothetical protein